MKVPKAEQREEWARRGRIILKLEGGRMRREDLFDYIDIPEEYREWAREYLVLYMNDMQVKKTYL